MKQFAPTLPPLARAAALLISAVLAGGALAAPPGPLPALNIDIEDTSVSGISSGGFMSVQMQVAHSGIIRGAGVVAGGPYYCAQDSVMKATTECSCTGEPTLSCKVADASAAVPELVAATRAFHAEGRIDDPAQIARQRVVTVVGGKDTLVPASIIRQLHGYYDAFGLPASALKPVTLDAAGHTMPTTAYGRACGVTDEPYIGKCGFEAAHAILDWIYGPAVAPPRTTPTPAGRFAEFDQRGYIPETGIFSYLWGTGLDKTGWVYIPPACAAGERGSEVGPEPAKSNGAFQADHRAEEGADHQRGVGARLHGAKIRHDDAHARQTGEHASDECGETEHQQRRPGERRKRVHCLPPQRMQRCGALMISAMR